MCVCGTCVCKVEVCLHELCVMYMCCVCVVYACTKRTVGGHQVSCSIIHRISLRQKSLPEPAAELAASKPQLSSSLCPCSAGVRHQRPCLAFYLGLRICTEALLFAQQVIHPSTHTLGLNFHPNKNDNLDTCMPCSVPPPPPAPEGPSISKGIMLCFGVWRHSNCPVDPGHLQRTRSHQ